MLKSIQGARYLMMGFKLMRQPGVRRYVVIPLIINILLFSLALALAIWQFDRLENWVQGQVPEWLAWLGWVMWLIFAVTFALVFFFTSSMVANLVSAPFNEYLSRAVERHLTGVDGVGMEPPLWKEIGRTLLNETRVLLYFVIRAIPLLILFLIPGINLLASVVWFGFSAWTLALDYSDYALARKGHSFPRLRQTLRRNRALSLGFGGATLGLTMIPLVNLLVIPAAVCGVTAMWVNHSPGNYPAQA